MAAATKPGLGAGTIVKMHNGTALTVLAEVNDCSIPEAETDEVETTHYASSGRIREFIAGLTDLGEIEVKMNYIPGSPTDVLCRAAATAKDNRAFQITIPDQAGAASQLIDFTGFVKKYSRSNPMDGLREATLMVRVAGAATETAAP
jgi:predicted secreted protein